MVGEYAPDAEARRRLAAARLPAVLATWVELAGRAYAGEAQDDWREHRAQAAAVAERLKREVGQACGEGSPGTG